MSSNAEVISGDQIEHEHVDGFHTAVQAAAQAFDDFAQGRISLEELRNRLRDIMWRPG